MRQLLTEDSGELSRNIVDRLELDIKTVEFRFSGRSRARMKFMGSTPGCGIMDTHSLELMQNSHPVLSVFQWSYTDWLMISIKTQQPP